MPDHPNASHTTFMPSGTPLRFLLGYACIWILLFQADRLLFLLFHSSDSARAGWGHTLLSLGYGLRMDASMATYLTLPMVLLLMTGIFLRQIRWDRVIRMYTLVVSIPVLLILFADIPAYGAWGYRLDATPLRYLQSPREVWASVSHLPLVWMALGFSLCVFGVKRIFDRWIKRNEAAWTDPPQKKRRFGILLLFGAALILPLRGGWQLAPLNQSSVYYSLKPHPNLCAVNPVWNFFHSLSLDLDESVNPYRYLQDAEAEGIRKQIFTATEPSIPLLRNSDSLNVVLIIWESFTQKAVDARRGGTDITPRFNAMRREGLYFSNLYASGDRTDKGIVAILSGYPAQPTTSIVKIPQKARTLPCLPRSLSGNGRQGHFYYGGELEFANMKSYLLGSGFATFTEKADFPTNQLNSKWGAHDGAVALRIQQDLSGLRQPYFLTWLTLSSHEPYETPVPPVITGRSDEDQFLNSLHYTDSIVGRLVDHLRSLPSWKNTLVVVVADHGHRLPRSDDRFSDFRIPMLWLGGALIPRDSVISSRCAQTDLPTTLLAQLRLPHDKFRWSGDALSAGFVPRAFLTFNNGFGYLQKDGGVLFDHTGKNAIGWTGPQDSTLIRTGQALQQTHFADYLGRP